MNDEVEIKSFPTCCWCNNILIKPIQVSCGHNLCGICIDTNINVSNKIKNEDKMFQNIGACKQCGKQFALLTQKTNMNTQFDEIIASVFPQQYSERLLLLEKSKIIPEFLKNFPIYPIANKLLTALTRFIEQDFDPKRIYFIDEFINGVLQQRELETVKGYKNPHIIIKFFITTLLSMRKNPLQRYHLTCMSINSLTSGFIIWCIYKTNYWTEYLEPDGDEFRPIDKELIQLIQLTQTKKICKGDNEKRIFGKRFQKIAIDSGQVNLQNSGSTRIDEFFIENIDKILTDPDFQSTN